MHMNDNNYLTKHDFMSYFSLCPSPPQSAEERLQSERLARQTEEEERHCTREAGLLSLRERARKDVGRSLKRRRRALQQREVRRAS